VNELRDRDGKPKWEDEAYDGPDAAGAKQQQQMDAQQQEGEGGEEDWGSLFGSNESMPWDEADKEANDTTKAAMASSASGEPGYVPIPTVYDGKNKPLKTLEEEDNYTLQMLDIINGLHSQYKATLDSFLAEAGIVDKKGE
jgi:hypothetical protein